MAYNALISHIRDSLIYKLYIRLIAQLCGHVACGGGGHEAAARIVDEGVASQAGAH